MEEKKEQYMSDLFETRPPQARAVLLFRVIVLTAGISALASGGFVYWWMGGNNQENYDELNRQLSMLQAQLSAVEYMRTDSAPPLPEAESAPEALAQEQAQAPGEESSNIFAPPPKETIDTIGWEIYESRNYDFSVAYPPDWDARISRDEVRFAPADDAEAIFHIIINDTIPSVGPPDEDGMHVVRLEPELFDGLYATRVVYRNTENDEELSRLYITYNSVTYSLTEPTIDNVQYPFPSSYNTIVQAMIDSFSFTAAE